MLSVLSIPARQNTDKGRINQAGKAAGWQSTVLGNHHFLWVYRFCSDRLKKMTQHCSDSPFLENNQRPAKQPRNRTMSETAQQNKYFRLKPCSCGASALVQRKDCQQYSGYVVMCSRSCPLGSFQKFPFRFRETAIENWNRRLQ